MDKYEYFTGEDLDSKTSTVEQAKFEYSPLGKIFNKGLGKDDKKEGLFKRLKKYWRSWKKQFNTDSKSLPTISYFRQLSAKVKKLYEKIKKEKNDIDPEKICLCKNWWNYF